MAAFAQDLHLLALALAMNLKPQEEEKLKSLVSLSRL